MRPRVRVAAGLACLLLAGAGTVLRAGADAAPGSGFLSFGISVTAPGTQFTYDFPGATPSPQAEGEVPLSIAQLHSGPQGYALATIAWPGPLVANAGSTSQILNLGLPPSSANQLNEPVRAEARTGSGPPTVTNSSYPGTLMTATATAAKVDADATTSGVSGPAPKSGSGDTETHSTAALTAAAVAVGTATSVVHNISLAGGVVKIQSVTSTATGTTNGVKASASGGTVVSGMTVAGQPAYIDQHGLHVGQTGPSAPVNAIASAIANQALAGFGMKVAVSQPVSRVNGGDVSYDAGNVVFLWPVPGDPHGDTFTATFGGASVSLSANPGTALPTIPTVVPLTPGAAPPAPIVTASPPASSGGTAPLGVTGPTGAEPPPVVNPTPITSARASVSLPRALSPVLPVLVVLGSVLIAGGLRRLPDRVLERSSTTCPFGG